MCVGEEEADLSVQSSRFAPDSSASLSNHCSQAYYCAAECCGKTSVWHGLTAVQAVLAHPGLLLSMQRKHSQLFASYRDVAASSNGHTNAVKHIYTVNLHCMTA